MGCCRSERQHLFAAASSFLRNHLSINVRTPDGREMGRSGYTLTICRKEADGQWRLCRDANLVVPNG